MFTGDTLFVGGCGFFFEGEASDMLKNFRLISKFEDSTSLFPGHEYTASNLKWVKKMDPKNPDLLEKWEVVKADPKGYHIPSSVGIEKKINMFMKCDDVVWQKRLEVKTAEEAMDKFRDLKTMGLAI